MNSIHRSLCDITHVHKIIATLRKKWVDSGKSIKTEKIRDIEFSVLVTSPDELGKADSYEEVFQILEQTFATNDFDGFSLRVGLARGGTEMGPCGCRQSL